MITIPKIKYVPDGEIIVRAHLEQIAEIKVQLEEITEIVCDLNKPITQKQRKIHKSFFTALHRINEIMSAINDYLHQ